MRRHTAPHEATPSAYYAAPMQPPRGYQADSGGTKSKRGWGDRLRLGKGEKGPPGTLLDEYWNKYGTLSSGSALSKSMKYAETWLYGSVSVRQGSNGVLLCPPGHHYVPGSPHCACSEFIAGTQRGKKTSAGICKKCGGSRIVWGPPGGTVRGAGGSTLRLGGGGGHSRVRPSLISLTPPPQQPIHIHPTTPPPQKSVTPDPYDLMRRHRLGNATISEGPQFIEPKGQFLLNQTRARSTSPGRRHSRHRTPSPPTLRLSSFHPEDRRRSSRRDLTWDQNSSSNELLSPDGSKRKSILECDVNAYELIAKYLKNGVPPPTGDEDIVESKKKGHFESVASDEYLLEDELSDNLSDNALENETLKKKKDKSKIIVNCSSKTDFKEKKKGMVIEDKNQRLDKIKPLGVTTIGGQSIRIFNETAHNLNKNDDNDVDFVVEDDGNKIDNDFKISGKSQIPRPCRPPRRQKVNCVANKKNDSFRMTECDEAAEEEEEGGDDREMESEEIACCESSLLLSTATVVVEGGNASGSAIKSILKKPSPSLPAGPSSNNNNSVEKNKKKNNTTKTFDSDTILEANSRASRCDLQTTQDFYLPTFQEFKQQNRRKKQVQFKVVVDQQQVVKEESCQVIDEADKQVNHVPSVSSVPKEGDINIKCCSSPKVQIFGDVDQNASVVSSKIEPTLSSSVIETKHLEKKEKEEDETNKDSVQRQDAVHPGRNTVVTLRRSHSDRQRDHSGRDPESRRQGKQQLFNDTMRLRLRTGGRTDSRQLFDVNFVHNSPIPKRPPHRMLSPVRPRPKEPPPPPPPLPLTPPIITTHPELPKREIFPFTKEELENINHQEISMPDEMCDEQIPTSAAVEDDSLSLPTRPERKMISSDSSLKSSRPNSWSPPHLTSSSPDENNLESMGGSKKRKEHRHSDPGPGPSNLSLHCENIPSDDHNSTSDSENDEVLVRTIVTVPPVSPPTSSPSDVHRLEVRAEPVLSYQIEVSPHPQRRTSILINGNDSAISPTINKTSSRTSVIIEDSNSSIPNNKVTINVGGINDADTTIQHCNSSSSCTVIDTGNTFHNSSSFAVQSPNPVIVIPVKSDDKKTRVFLDHCSNVEVSGEESSSRTIWHDESTTGHDVKYVPSTVLFVDGDNDSYKGSITTVGSKSSSRSIVDQSKELDDKDTASILLDPVEAVKRNLIPHVCGKKDEESPSAMDRLSSLISQQPDENITEKMKENDYFLTTADSKVLDPSVIDLLRSDSMSTDDSTNEISSSSCDPITAKNEEDENSTSDLPLSRPQFVITDTAASEIPEKEKQDGDVELRIIDDNIYESIKDPIYEEIPETPPPLPLSPPPSLDDVDDDKRGSRSIFEGASKYDILSYLEGAKERGIVPEESDYGGSANGDEATEAGKESLGDLSSRVSHLSNTSDSSEDSCNLIITDDTGPQSKVRKSSAEIERNDSGVGSETSKSSRSRWQPVPAGSLREDQQLLCEDCDQRVETQVTDSGVMFAPLVCRKCGKKRAERKEIIAEIVETEEKYGRDLQIILDEFYRPMLVAGLLTPEQLSAIFLNVEELLENGLQLAEKLRDTLEIAIEQGDEDLLTVNMGKIFLDAAPMLHAFESYCTRQAAASLLLANLEKEKELLSIFLRVSQMENAVLRRMNLNSFLMVPVQRVTKYPLLLARLYKVTPAHHQGREQLKQAQHKIELHLEHMNSETKDVTTTKLWRRISIINLRRPSSETDMIIIKLRKMALDILGWNPDESRFAMEGKLFYTNPTDNNWRRGRTVKLNPINAVLVTKGKPLEDYSTEPPEEPLMFARKSGVQEATLLLVKEKCGRYSLLREPLYLDKCIVCCDNDWEDYFELQELANKETYIFKGEDGERTKIWYRQLQFHAQGLGAWRRRRNALANIMINGMLTRS